MDLKQLHHDVVKWIQTWFEDNGNDCNAIIGISGGKDSTLVAKLCVDALGKDRVIGIMMPNDANIDLELSKEICTFLGIQSYTIPIGSIKKAFIHNYETSCQEIPSSTALLNLEARLRMVYLYMSAQTHNGRVSNNCNLSERWIGYSTRFGDDAGDFSPLANITVSELQELATYIGIPKKWAYKIPIDGLQENLKSDGTALSDEENFGFSYETLDRYIRTGICHDTVIKAKIDKMYKNSEFKRHVIASFAMDIKEYNK